MGVARRAPIIPIPDAVRLRLLGVENVASRFAVFGVGGAACHGRTNVSIHRLGNVQRREEISDAVDAVCQHCVVSVAYLMVHGIYRPTHLDERTRSADAAARYAARFHPRFPVFRRTRQRTSNDVRSADTAHRPFIVFGQCCRKRATETPRRDATEALQPELDTIRLDPTLVNSENYFVTPRGLTDAVRRMREEQPGITIAATHMKPLSSNLVGGVPPQVREHLVIDDTQRRLRNSVESMLHMSLYLQRVDYLAYEKANEARRAAFRQAVADQVAANASIPVKLLSVTRVAHGSIIVDLDYEVPPGAEDQAVAIAALLNLLARWIQGPSTRGAGFSVLSQGRVQDLDQMHVYEQRAGGERGALMQLDEEHFSFGMLPDQQLNTPNRRPSPTRGLPASPAGLPPASLAIPYGDQPHALLDDVRRDVLTARAHGQSQRQSPPQRLQQLFGGRNEPSYLPDASGGSPYPPPDAFGFGQYRGQPPQPCRRCRAERRAVPGPFVKEVGRVCGTLYLLPLKIVCPSAVLTA